MGGSRIVVLPGDGIGPEVMEVSPRESCGMPPRDQWAWRWNSPSTPRASSTAGAPVKPCPDMLDDFLRADAVFPAAIGLPEVRRPDGTEVQTEMMNGTAPQLAGRDLANPLATVLRGP